MATKMLSATEILSDLVAFPTVSHRSNLDMIGYLEDYLGRYGVGCHRIGNEEGDKAGLCCRIGPAVDGGLILSGHTDVVPVTGQPWDSDPFILVERHGLFYGRGAADMKGFLACCLAQVPAMVKADLKRPIYLAFSYDEEVGCQGGPPLIAAIQRTYQEKPRFAIIGEPTQMQPVTGQKGIGVLRTTVTGSQGHSSLIREEVSAVHVAARLVTWLEDKMEALVRAGRCDDRFRPNHTTLHVGRFEGGVAPNVIAGTCFFDWDIRVIPGDDPLAILEEFQLHGQAVEAELHQRFAGAKITTVPHHPFVPALDTSPGSDFVSLVCHLSGTDEVATVAYASEAGQFARAGLEAVICGPGSIAQAHRANEFISAGQLKKGETFIRKVVTEMEREQ